MQVRIIGDVHGKIEEYINLIKNQEYSIQLGDMGFADSYETIKLLMHQYHIDPSRHWFVRGNHDNTNTLPTNCVRFYTMLFEHFFCIAGAESTDKHLRAPFVSWWPDEELSYGQMDQCQLMWEKEKPHIALSHDCPYSIYPYLECAIYNPSITSTFLDELLSIHQPKLWLFGHHHQNKLIQYNNTTFQCLDELSYVDIPILDWK